MSGASKSTSGASNFSPRSVERPQGFEDAKLAKRGLFRCSWGCEDLFHTKKEAFDHPSCSARRNTYEDLLEMNRLSGRREPIEYLEEVSEEISLQQIENACSLVASPVLSEQVGVSNRSSGLTEELIKTLPKMKRMKYVEEWLGLIDLNL